MKRCWILSKAFSASFERIMWFCLCFYLCAVLRLWISVCWTILVWLNWNCLDHNV
jgi:hypothetical protein